MTNDLKILFDSSVLICDMVEAHPKHNPALSWLKRAKDKEFRFLVSAHSLLEIYSVLTTNARVLPSDFSLLIISTSRHKVGTFHNPLFVTTTQLIPIPRPDFLGGCSEGIVSFVKLKPAEMNAYAKINKICLESQNNEIVYLL